MIEGITWIPSSQVRDPYGAVTTRYTKLTIQMLIIPIRILSLVKYSLMLL